MRAALDNLEWMVGCEVHNSETTDNWHRPGVDPATIKTEVFLLPSAHRIEKEGTISNSGRWLQWFDKAIEPQGEARDFGHIMVPLMNKVRELYKAEGGVHKEPILGLRWPEDFKAEEWTKRINGYYEADVTAGDKTFRKGQLVDKFMDLKADGTTSSLNWLYCNSYTEEGGNKAKRRDLSQTPMQEKLGIYPNWSWCWPVNRRVLYNRASVDVKGKPWNPDLPVIMWDETAKKWVGDVVDGGGVEPAGGVVFEQLEALVDEPADITAHAQMECGIIELGRAEVVADLDRGVELLMNLARERLLWRFAFLHLAAGKFPPALVITVSPLGREHFALPHDDSSHNFYAFQHQAPFLSRKPPG